MDKLIKVLVKNQKNFGKVLDIDFSKPFSVLNLTTKNKELNSIDLTNAKLFSKYIKKVLKKDKTSFAVGKYDEDRTVYKSDLFSSDKRTIHLGIDLMVDSGTRVLAPIDGKVHSFANNKIKGDYGPTIILEHNLDRVTFYTLYGHLSLDSIDNLYEGKLFKKGEIIGKVGNFPINGDYPPHLHFEIIRDIQGKKGDFPGVASKETEKQFLYLCPDPNLILQLKFK